jgi:hypothetical protein
MTKVNGHSRKIITGTREQDIIDIILNWDATKDKLTREGLVKRVTCKLGFTVTRQGLMKRDAIRKAYEEREREIAEGQALRNPREPLEEMYERRLKAKNEELEKAKAKIATYEELFVRYRYNANLIGIDPARLEAPILPHNTGEGSRG